MLPHGHILQRQSAGYDAPRLRSIERIALQDIDTKIAQDISMFRCFRSLRDNFNHKCAGGWYRSLPGRNVPLPRRLRTVSPKGEQGLAEGKIPQTTVAFRFRVAVFDLQT